jgi:AcrR family transcriptional regulator
MTRSERRIATPRRAAKSSRSARKTGPGRPLGSEGAVTRKRIIESARRCFSQYGYGPATNSIIAEAAGVTTGAVHYHCGTKDRLFDAVCEDVYSQIMAQTSGAVSQPMSVTDLLRTLLRDSLRINRECPELASFVATAPIEARRYPELTAAFAKYPKAVNEGVVKAVKLGQKAGLIPEALDARQIALLIYTVGMGFDHVAAETDPDTTDSLNQLFDELVLSKKSRR